MMANSPEHNNTEADHTSFHLSGEKYIAIKTTHTPYSTSAPIDALEAAMAATNIGLKVVYIFSGLGVLQLQVEQQAQLIKHKNTFKRLMALPLFDVDDIYIDKQACENFAINTQTLDFDHTMVGIDEIEMILNSAHQVLVF